MSIRYRFLFLAIISQLSIVTAIASPRTHNHRYVPQTIHQPHHAVISKTAKTKMQSLAAIA